MEYRSVKDLNDRVADWAGTLAGDLDLVVGIPRSGMLPANLLSLFLHLPLTDLNGLCEGRIMRAGGQRGLAELDPNRPLNVLVVDDSVCSGGSMREARAQVAAAGLPHRVRFGAVFVTPEAVREAEVDLFAEAVPAPRVFEWNVLHTPQLARVCVALEGVLCLAPDAADKRTEGHFRNYIRTASPDFVPRHRLGWVVTTRSERWREETEKWLARQGVDFGTLLMASTGSTPDAELEFKADAYRATTATLFVEGERDAAAALAERSGRPVFCLAVRSMVYPGHYPRQRQIPVRPPHPLEQALRQTWRLPRRLAGRLWRIARRGAPTSGPSNSGTLGWNSAGGNRTRSARGHPGS